MPGPLSTTNIIAGFPQSWGSKIVSIIDHKGPASYATFASGIPPTGGDSISAAEAGMKFIDAVIPLGLSDNGAYQVWATPGIGNASEVPSFFLAWYSYSSFGQAGNGTNL